jgi:rhamnose transport system ATP-binding protein
MYSKTSVTPGEVVLEVENLARDNVFRDISFTVRRGEIVALAGLVGAGRTEVARAVFGIDRRSAGSVRLQGKPLRGGEPAAAMAQGMAFVPEDRRQQGLVMDLGIDHNMALASLGRLRKAVFIFRGAERRLAGTWADRLHLRYGRLRDPVSTLSGGNQQKVVLGKWLARQPSLLIIDELAAAGTAVLMISSELPEVLGLADRILVLHEGRLAGEFARADATEDKIMRAATGQAELEAA